MMYPNESISPIPRTETETEWWHRELHRAHKEWLFKMPLSSEARVTVGISSCVDLSFWPIDHDLSDTVCAKEKSHE